MQVQLSFGAAHGAWDDRGLIDACDAAMEEFHAHHPGPGTWLDKATAAQLAGRPLPGVDSASIWYLADTVDTTAGSSRSAKAQQHGGRSAKRRRQSPKAGSSGQELEVDTITLNPYGSTTSTRGNQDHAVSPRYAPSSPARSDGHAASPTHAPIEPSISHDEPLHTDVAFQPIPPPPIGIRPLGSISGADAMGYAMAAQYWAGYWMGVAQAQTTAPAETHQAGSTAQSHDSAPPLDAREPRVNVQTTRVDHSRRINGDLRR